MKANPPRPVSVESYIASTPAATQKLLAQLRKAIQAAALAATEKICYGIPTFYLQGNLVHFAAYKNHIGFYPGASGIKAFQKQLSLYKSAKGSVQFALTAPLPLALIGDIVRFRVNENSTRG